MAKTNTNDNLSAVSGKDTAKDISALAAKSVDNLDSTIVDANDNITKSTIIDSVDNQDNLSITIDNTTNNDSPLVGDTSTQENNANDKVQVVSVGDSNSGDKLSDNIDIVDNNTNTTNTNCSELDNDIDEAQDTVDIDANATALPYTLNEDDLGDEPPLSYIERVELAMANRPKEVCTRDGAMDEKLSKYSTIACIPFFVAGIVVTIFNKAKYRSPWAFLLIGLAVFALAIGSWLRYRNNKKCTCSVCETQAKNLRNSVILWGVLGLCCMIAFAVFLVINIRAGMI